MADAQRSGLADRDIEQAITALKKGAYLLKYGRRGKPKFCPFHLSSDESSLIWYSGKYEKQLRLSQVSKIIPGQRTAIFQRYPRPEKEYQSFSLICNDRSLDLICKDKDEAEVWFVALKALIARGNYHSKWRIDARSECSDSPRTRSRKHSPSDVESGDGQGIQVSSESSPQCRMGKAFSDIITYTAPSRGPYQAEPASNSFASLINGYFDNTNGRSSTADTVRVSLSSALSSSSQGSYHEVFDALGDAFIWGEGISDGMLGGGVKIAGSSSSLRVDALLPKALESTVVLDVHNIACGGRHAVLVTRQGEMFSWGEESGGRLGHGIEVDVPYPKLIDNLSGMNIELIACGEYHTCAVSLSGDLFTWGDGVHNCGFLGHGSEASHWIPKKVSGDLDGLRVSYISCGPWHTAAVTSSGQLFTFGDGTFGVLGHGDRSSTNVPREVEALRGLRTTRVACGVWHTAAVVELVTESSDPETTESGNSSSGQLFTWGDGDKGRLGHGDNESSFIPKCVTTLADDNICQVACGHHLTVALTSSGQVYTMGGTDYGQLGSPTADGKIPSLVTGKIADSFIEHISCGSYHVAVLTSKAELYTWGRGTNGQLGHGDYEDRDSPVLVHSLRDKQVKAAVCGSNVTAIICIHKSISSADHSVCSGCRNQFGFRRKRHNCYNCGLVFCKVCSSRKSMKASLAPNMSRPYRVCDDCYNKLKKAMESGSGARYPRTLTGNNIKSSRMIDKEALGVSLQAQASRLSCADSCSRAESWTSSHHRRADSDSTFIFPTMGENFQLLNFNSSKVSTLLDGAMKKILPNSSPGSKWASLAANLLSERRSPPRCSSETIDSKQMNDNLREEISSLRSQVEELNTKSQLLEAELERKSRELKEASAIAADEAEKCKSANEVIKSLSTQLKEISETEGHRNNRHSGSSAKHTSFTGNMSSSSTAKLAQEVENNGHSIDNQMLSYTQPGKPHWVLQAEHGVYITLSSLPTGGNELKRIRFSRKHFTEQQAEKWWTENGSRVCELHNIKVEDDPAGVDLRHRK